jgi:hypothetical protein
LALYHPARVIRSMTILRRLRGAVGVGVVWGVAFSTLATALLLGGIVSGVIPSIVFGPRDVISVAIRAFVVGGLAGMVFAAALASAERQRTLANLSIKRAALWGFLGAACVPAILAVATGAMGLLPVGVIASGVAVFGVIGGALSIATVRIARRAPALPRELGTLDGSAGNLT